MSYFLYIKLSSKEFLCLKISCLIGWTIVLRDWVQDLDAFRKILNISCMLKSIATARSECTASYNTYYIVPDLIDFFG